MTETAAAHAGSTDPTARRGVAAATDRWSRLVDHSWLLLGDRDNDVLFCVAGSLHTTDQVAGCAYWIRTTLAERLRRQLPDAGRQEAAGASPLHYDGATYVKLPALAPPPAWPAVYAALGHLGVRPVEASLLAVAQLAAARGILDPRHAVREAAALPGHGHDCGLRVLHQLLTAIGDPAGTQRRSRADRVGRLRPGPAVRLRPQQSRRRHRRHRRGSADLRLGGSGPTSFGGGPRPGRDQCAGRGAAG